MDYAAHKTRCLPDEDFGQAEPETQPGPNVIKQEPGSDSSQARLQPEPDKPGVKLKSEPESEEPPQSSFTRLLAAAAGGGAGAGFRCRDCGLELDSLVQYDRHRAACTADMTSLRRDLPSSASQSGTGCRPTVTRLPCKVAESLSVFTELLT